MDSMKYDQQMIKTLCALSHLLCIISLEIDDSKNISIFERYKRAGWSNNDANNIKCEFNGIHSTKV